MKSRSHLCLSLMVGIATGLAGCNPGGDAGASVPSERVLTGRPAVDDSTLSARVRSALIADGAVAGANISVTSSKGEVTLSGQVPADQITRADTIARSVEGVTEVINTLTPELPAS